MPVFEINVNRRHPVNVDVIRKNVDEHPQGK
ncbi:hypothetical protein CA85_23370 [Allorhodopirellula solitaria]|uniref:Uncharacterized protein n=1 Tax=Allorhodopirellula solitaria TaxID=2527987 RepID=A0A5C5XVX8_9BACT|nr:hypothetical protein CA85_23370 [Allorhodopirellula solitaria]